ncbi:MAG: hypothetical protein ACFB0Z_06890 [Candidatus Phaeomarinobacter sp.]
MPALPWLIGLTGAGFAGGVYVSGGVTEVKKIATWSAVAVGLYVGAKALKVI